MKGYSLLELIIALALLSLITLAMSGGVRFGARAWDASEVDVAAVERVQGAQNLLRALLQRAMPRELDPTFAVDLDLFRGSAQSLSFTGGAPSAVASHGLARFDLRVEGQKTKQLVLSWQESVAAKAVRREVLIAGASTISFAYASREAQGGLRWLDSWRDQSGAPALVAVRASFPPGSAERWPPLLVRTRVTHDPLCLYNADTFGCPHA